MPDSGSDHTVPRSDVKEKSGKISPAPGAVVAEVNSEGSLVQDSCPWKIACRGKSARGSRQTAVHRPRYGDSSERDADPSPR